MLSPRSSWSATVASSKSPSPASTPKTLFPRHGVTCKPCSMPSLPSKMTALGSPMPDPGSQLYERDFAALARDMPDDKLHDTRRDLATGLGLLMPGSLMYAPAHEYL